MLKLLLSLFFFFLYVVFFNDGAPAPQSIVKTLPGYQSGTLLPFQLETGYVTVGEKEDVELFYYFIESERDPDKDPLMLWLTGGPGCSAFSALVYEIGPLSFDLEGFDGTMPTFLLNPYSWTKIASIIFLDSPVGTGFSYATTPQGYSTSDTKNTQHIYEFLVKWSSEHPKFIKNRLYIAGDSYAGKIVPMVAYKISQGFETGLGPSMNLQGYVIGNPLTDTRIDGNARVPFVHRLAILSDEYYEMAMANCGGEFVSPDPTNGQCLYALQFYRELIRNINKANVLERACELRSSEPDGLASDWANLGDDDEHDSSLIRALPRSSRCRSDIDVLSTAWANNAAVQQALHIKSGTIKEWRRCNITISYDKNVRSVVHYHKLLSQKGYEALVYSGDHGMVIPYMGTLNWIRLLNLTVDDNWRPWLVDAQVAGYTERYMNDKTQSHLTFATVKGGGHTAPEYKPKECFAMLERFLELYPL